MTQTRQKQISETAPSPTADEIDRLLVGAVDLHCHTGPSVMPRCIDHIAAMDDMTTLAGMGAYLEHSMCMFIEGSIYQFYDNDNLRALVEAGTIEKTILGSDLGQNKNSLPVDGFRSVVGICLEIDYSEEEIRRMTGGNACELMGLEQVRHVSLAATA